ncbi:MAG: hypothetical protein JWM98_3170 [Thermoleophilia bacterium]|nr:hypothetical protein [Thermoleophilia bacterium]
MNVVTPRIDFLLRRLVQQAGELRDQLATGDWEAAAPIREEFDEGFAMLQRLVETGHAFEPRHANDLAQLRHVHAENEAIVRELRRTAGVEIGTVSNVRRINSAYAPMGPTHRSALRIVDGSA